MRSIGPHQSGPGRQVSEDYKLLQVAVGAGEAVSEHGAGLARWSVPGQLPWTASHPPGLPLQITGEFSEQKRKTMLEQTVRVGFDPSSLLWTGHMTHEP